MSAIPYERILAYVERQPPRKKVALLYVIFISVGVVAGTALGIGLAIGVALFHS